VRRENGYVPGSNAELVRAGFVAVSLGDFDLIAELPDPG
jgi:hypothetical protein